MKRNIIVYLLILVSVIIAGLSSRRLDILPEFIHKYAGDTFWALMVFLLIAIIYRNKSSLWVASAALIFSYLIEISQFYHAPWIDTLRATTIGGLILGFGFLWSDIICYTVGIGVGYAFEIVFNINRKRKTR